VRVRHKHLHALASALVASLVAAGIVVASTPGPDSIDVSSWKATSKNNAATRLSVTTKAPIPRHADAFIRSNPVVGLAWVDTQTSKAFVATIHPVLGRDSRQNPRAWHAHTVTLATGATAPNDFCLASIDSSPTVGLSIHGATMRVNTRSSKLPVPASAFDLAAGFTVQQDTACASGLGVRVST
jgi:hypothetical protein